LIIPKQPKGARLPGSATAIDFLGIKLGKFQKLLYGAQCAHCRWRARIAAAAPQRPAGR
jgi:hypothetical protein